MSRRKRRKRRRRGGRGQKPHADHLNSKAEKGGAIQCQCRCGARSGALFRYVVSRLKQKALTPPTSHLHPTTCCFPPPRLCLLRTKLVLPSGKASSGSTHLGSTRNSNSEPGNSHSVSVSFNCYVSENVKLCFGLHRFRVSN